MNRLVSTCWTGFGIITLFLMQGCAPASYKVVNPSPSQVPYQKSADASPLVLTVTDARAEDEKVFSYGVLNADLMLNNKPLLPVGYLKENTVEELNARGVATALADQGGLLIDINKLVMRNHRVNAYTPFVTFTMLNADVHTPEGEKRIGVYIKRGKVPVWSFAEIVEPTLNEPLSLLVKEFSAKVNALTVNQSASDEQVAALVDEINRAEAGSYLKVYQLGFTNNKAAIAPLVEYTKHDDEYIRLAAISSLGILSAESELDHLKEIYTTGNLWQDRGMALKAICDIGTPDAMAFAKKVLAEQESVAKENPKEAEWTREILGLYL